MKRIPKNGIKAFVVKGNDGLPHIVCPNMLKIKSYDSAVIFSEDRATELLRIEKIYKNIDQADDVKITWRKK